MRKNNYFIIIFDIVKNWMNIYFNFNIYNNKILLDWNKKVINYNNIFIKK